MLQPLPQNPISGKSVSTPGVAPVNPSNGLGLTSIMGQENKDTSYGYVPIRTNTQTVSNAQSLRDRVERYSSARGAAEDRQDESNKIQDELAIGSAFLSAVNNPTMSLVSIGGVMRRNSEQPNLAPTMTNYIQSNAVELYDLMNSREYQENPSVYREQVQNLYHTMHNSGIGSPSGDAKSGLTDANIEGMLEGLGITREVLDSSTGYETPDYHNQSYGDWYRQQQGLADIELQRRSGNPNLNMYGLYNLSQESLGGVSPSIMDDYNFWTGGRKIDSSTQIQKPIDQNLLIAQNFGNPTM